MKRCYLPVLVHCVNSCLRVALAQQTAQPQSPVASSTTTAQSFAQQVRDNVAFLTVVYQDGAAQKAAIGTCFFISVVDKRLPEDQNNFVYLVTNRHVAQPGIDLHTPYQVLGSFLRMNLAKPTAEIQSQQAQIPLQFHWYFPEDEGVDLAIMPIAPPRDVFEYINFDAGIIVTADMVKAGDVVVGDRVVFSGYFSNFPGQKRVEPIVRQGVIAMLPDETLDTTLHKPGHMYLADLHAFHGNSGSPVFVDSYGGVHHGRFQVGEHYLLLGILTGYYPESVGFSVPAAMILTGEVRDNSGIAAIVPADELRKLLNSAQLQAERDRAVATLTKKP